MARAGKTERGRQTRARIRDAATTLFRQRGYLDTTMAAIAAEAGVAVQTLYLAFGSKVAILAAAHDVAVGGDEAPLPVLDRPWVAEVRAEPDGTRALAVLVDQALRIIERVSPIYGVIQAAAADAEVRQFLDLTKSQRLDTMRALAAELASKPGFTRDLSLEQTADTLYALVSDDVYRLLVVERRWPAEAWKTWTYNTAAHWLFPGRAPKGPLSG
ncbi:MAG TPA: TetR/AcrR family transcriptional regulator [Actinomycetota bacterium]|nr:TetR/AcrR family transcriptional regulator [Actinomycetota bacterium]